MSNLATMLMLTAINTASNDRLNNRFLLYFKLPVWSFLNEDCKDTDIGIPLFSIAEDKIFSVSWCKNPCYNNEIASHWSMLEQNATAILGFDETQTLLNEPYL